MDKTPKGKSLRFVKTYETAPAPDSVTYTCTSSTPVKESKRPRKWETGLLCSQDNKDIDVTWDWDSPKNIKPKLQRTKRKELHKSPQLVMKKTSQVDHIKNFEKLREELQALKDEIARVDDDCLPLSPVDEQTFKEESNKDCSDINSFIEEQYFHIESQECESYNIDIDRKKEKNKIFNDLFDDSCDEQLILCSQIIEEKLKYPEKQNCNPMNSENSKKIFTNGYSPIAKAIQNSFKIFNDSDNSFLEDSKRPVKVENTEDLLSMSYKIYSDHKSTEDSFDAALKKFKDADIDKLTQSNIDTSTSGRVNNTTFNSSFKRTFSDANVEYMPQKQHVKTNFSRTQSFESATTPKQDKLPKHILEEIERKRLEALARLKEKREKDKKSSAVTTLEYSNISPMKCSPEEIEQKRLKAKAIREARQKEIIERNRQEALKRLENNRLKRLENMKKACGKK